MKTMKKKNLFLGGGIFVFVVIAFFAFQNGFTGNHVASSTVVSGKVITLYKSPSCGCCSLYVEYLKKAGFQVNVVKLPDLTQIKQQAGVPSQFSSCHTMKIGNYYVEGHVPVEAIEKLLQEQPAVKTIGLAGMPPGTPGMPGAKQGTWQIYAIDAKGNVDPFMEI